MHDIGKIGIPAEILLKPAKLTTEEFALMKTHTTIGANILGGRTSGDYSAGGDNRFKPPRKMGWRRLSARVKGRGNSDRGKDI